MTWQLTAGANAVVGVLYLAIAGTIVAVLSQGGRLRTHTLGQAALLAFGTVGIQFCLIAALLLAPSLGIDSSHGEALRDAWPALLGVWAVIGGAAALFLLTQRGSYGDVLLGPGLMDEVRARERQAFEINENLVQGLSVAKYSFEQGQEDRGRRAVNESLMRARKMTTDLLGEPGAPDDQVARASCGGTDLRPSGEGWMEVAETADTISVFLVDDVPELRELIRYGLEGDEDFVVVGEAGDGAAAIEGIAETAPCRRPARPLDARHGRPRGDPRDPPRPPRHRDRHPLGLLGLPHGAKGARARRRRLRREGHADSGPAPSGPRSGRAAREQQGQQGRLNGDEPPRRLVGKRGTQDSNLESPTLEAGALASLASAPRGPNRSRATQGRG